MVFERKTFMHTSSYWELFLTILKGHNIFRCTKSGLTQPTKALGNAHIPYRQMFQYYYVKVLQFITSPNLCKPLHG